MFHISNISLEYYVHPSSTGGGPWNPVLCIRPIRSFQRDVAWLAEDPCIIDHPIFLFLFFWGALSLLAFVVVGPLVEFFWVFWAQTGPRSNHRCHGGIAIRLMIWYHYLVSMVTMDNVAFVCLQRRESPLNVGRSRPLFTVRLVGNMSHSEPPSVMCTKGVCG